jgi:hypothetical protein
VFRKLLEKREKLKRPQQHDNSNDQSHSAKTSAPKLLNQKHEGGKFDRANESLTGSSKSDDARKAAYLAAKDGYTQFSKELDKRPDSIDGKTKTGVMLAGIVVEKLGHLEEAHHERDFVFPVGFRAKRMFTDGEGRQFKATQQISPGPRFVVILEMKPGGESRAVKAESDHAVMRQVLHYISVFYPLPSGNITCWLVVHRSRVFSAPSLKFSCPTKCLK